MRRLAFTLLLVATGWTADYRLALPGYQFEFPRDHFGHPEFRTEWWYYTGNLKTPEGRRFGFELTFFRHALARTGDNSTWNLENLYLAHLALSDIQGNEFFHEQRLNRAGPGIAGVSFEDRRIWNGNWRVAWKERGQELVAVTDRYTLRLALMPGKPPVIHGENGVSQKAAGDGRASHYISFTRLEASGTLELDGRQYELRGLTWMDHEFFTDQLDPNQTGWDWFSIQLDNEADLMLFRIRGKNGAADPFSAGTYVSPDGATRQLRSEDFVMEPGGTWRSPHTGAEYPLEWRLRIIPLSIELRAAAVMEDQELIGDTGIVPTYWEGAMDYSGTVAGRPIRGSGYLEMTGYAEPFTFGQATGP